MKRTKIHRYLTVLFLAFILAAPVAASAAIPTTMNYQGYLTSSGGSPVNGTVTMTFRVYDTATGGTSLWEETLSVDVSNGVYSVVLGATNPLNISWWEYPGAYLGVTVGTDTEMTPRQELTSVPYALSANDARWSDMAYDLNCTGCVSPIELSFTPGDITSVTAGTGLTGGGTTGDVTFSVNTSLIQNRVSGTCAAGSSIRTINQNGTVVCEVDDDSNTTYSAGTGLNLVGTTFGVQVPLDLSGSTTLGIVRGTNGYATGYGVYGAANGASGRGVYGYAPGTSGVGVYGYATNTGDVTNYGGAFHATGTTGRGVYGYASGSNGWGVYGNVTGANGWGVYGATSGASGIGVHGFATNTGNVTNYGGYFTAYGASGRGVYSNATGDNGRGVSGYASGASGVGVWGEAPGNTLGRGVVGWAGGTNGFGVSGYGGNYDFWAMGPGTNYGSLSSIRWKKNIEDIDHALDKVLKIRGVYFDWDEEHGGHHDMGFVAEEVGKVIPEIVAYEEDGVYATGIDYGAITPMLVQAIKEQHKLIYELRAEIEELKKRPQPVVDTNAQETRK